ncbi:hypothetical protein ARMGADRAFT_1030011 [Armillaria gallica]|uniref:Uncharacterized protein n=1 Tax=Armillaria gallica TaxID=47427 RepID=A0A2H3DYH4_ARMGA|nr:hypothetical protein ARMGADRAFT_1030011 [Armillaria gallica]
MYQGVVHVMFNTRILKRVRKAAWASKLIVTTLATMFKKLRARMGYWKLAEDASRDASANRRRGRYWLMGNVAPVEGNEQIQEEESNSKTRCVAANDERQLILLVASPTAAMFGCLVDFYKWLTVGGELVNGLGKTPTFQRVTLRVTWDLEKFH